MVRAVRFYQTFWVRVVSTQLCVQPNTSSKLNKIDMYDFLLPFDYCTNSNLLPEAVWLPVCASLPLVQPMPRPPATAATFLRRPV